MRKFLMVVPAALLLATFTPQVAPASGELSCIEQCDKDFPGNSPEQVAIRGWCYILRGCWLQEDSAWGGRVHRARTPPNPACM